MKIAIVIGIDGLGKTELCHMMESLHSQHKVRKVVEDPRALRPGEALEKAELEVARWNIVSHEGSTRLLIYDRFPYPDEWVYGSLTGPPDWIGPTVKEEWDSLLLRHGATLVYVQPPTWRAYQQRESDSILDTKNRAVFDEIVEGYNEVLRRTNLRVIRLEPVWFTQEDAIEVVRAVFSGQA